MKHVILSAVLLAVLCAAPAPGGAQDRVSTDERVRSAMERQPQMVLAATGALSPQRPGVRDLYFIGIAGWGDQDVFLKEVRAVRKLFETSFGAAGRTVTLINHLDTLDEQPVATNETIEAAVQGVAAVMDRDEDLLVLFMTSHGLEWDGLALQLDHTRVGALLPAQLARMLGFAQIRNRVVVVSACYSGQFVPALAEEHTLLITAAASDRSSFGCTSSAEWTWFGRAFFKEALPKLGKFEPAFEAAARRIGRWEKREGYKSSVPQIRTGSDIRAVLDEMGL